MFCVANYPQPKELFYYQNWNKVPHKLDFLSKKLSLATILQLTLDRKDSFILAFAVSYILVAFNSNKPRLRAVYFSLCNAIMSYIM